MGVFPLVDTLPEGWKAETGAVVYRCFTGCVPPGEIGIMWYADIEPTMYKTTINIEDVMESFHLAKYRRRDGEFSPR